ncbi:MAG: hypothetical protein EXS00_01120 [Phycisphaerales bacterium]|nr:hypothetical protein [Phycisphaerales bacterium]
MKFYISTCASLLSCSLSADAAVRYVNVGLASGANNGTSWVDAYQGATGIVTALSASVSGDSIWVAAGTYKPTITTSRTVAHTLKTGVAVYGGFTGIETGLSARDWVAHPCIITGDLLGNDTTVSTTWADNSYHLVIGSGALATAILDGFTVRAGNANGATASNYDKGGGIIITNSGAPTIRNCTFIANRCTFGGGAGYMYNTSGPTFEDCVFADNVGGSYGGAFDTNAVLSKFLRCSFINNQAARAGAIEVFSGNCTITNCLFRNNKATTSAGGGGVWVGNSSSCTIGDSSFASNSCTGAGGGGVYITASATTLANCIFWSNTGNSTVANNQIMFASGTIGVTYSTVQGGYTGVGNLSTDPLFVSLALGDLHLTDLSPGIDSGANASVPSGTVTDRDGAPRFVDVPGIIDTGVGTPPMVDRGCYEKQVPPPPPCIADLSSDGAVNGLDLALLLGQWGSVGSGDINGDGSIDGGDLGMMLAAWGACP